MPTLLNDAALKELLGTVILDGHADSLRPNSYVIRLGSDGEFINTGKEFMYRFRFPGQVGGLIMPPSG